MVFIQRSRWVWSLLAALLILAFIVQMGRFYHPVYGFTSLIQLDSSSEPTMLPELRERPTFVYRDTGGYDGQYYAQLACRPTLSDPALTQAIDNLGYRARRCLTSWTAWLLGFGDPTRALDIYTMINPVCWLALAVLLMMIFPLRSAHDFLAWVGLLCSAGALASVRLALTDLPALTLIVAAVVLWQRQRMRGATGMLAAALLARETSLFAFPAFRGDNLKSTVGRGLACVAPLALWYSYVRYVCGPGSDGWDNLTWPGVNFVAKWRYCLGDLANTKDPLLAWTSLLSLIGLTVQAGWLLFRPAWQNIWWRLGIGYVGLMLLLGWAPWEGYPGAATRVLLPLQLAFNALAPRTRRGFLLLLAGNLSFASGLLFILPVPRGSDELASAKFGSTACVAQAGQGFYLVEHSRNHHWAWARNDAVLRLQAWRDSGPVAVRFKLNVYRPPCTVTITQGKRIVWSGEVDRSGVPIEIKPVSFATDGTAQLHLVSDQSPLVDHDSVDGRAVVLSIWDLEFAQ